MTHKPFRQFIPILKPTAVLIGLFVGFTAPISNVSGGMSGGSSGGHGGSCSSIGISNTQSLKFGTFATSTSGNVVISTSGNRSSSGGVLLLGGTYQSASFNVTGTANCSYSISLPSSTSMSNGSQSMTINSFTKNPSNGSLNSSGYQNLDVGATLQASSGQQEGSYSGSFTVTVNYN